jgi:hypothetical protein
MTLRHVLVDRIRDVQSVRHSIVLTQYVARMSAGRRVQQQLLLLLQQQQSIGGVLAFD